MQKMLTLMFVVAVVCVSSACSKPFLYGQKQEMEPVSRVVSADISTVMPAAKRALEINGYMVQKETGTAFETNWSPATPDSHYVELFGRQDRGVVGAYHKIVVSLSPEGGGTRVEVNSVAKSIVNNLRSTKIEEKKILKKIEDFTHPADVQVTNIGLQ